MITLECKIHDQTAVSKLRQLNHYFSHVARYVFLDLFIRNIPLAQVKKESKKYGINNRHFSSIRSELTGRVNAAKDNLENEIDQKKTAVSKLKKTIKKNHSRLKKIATQISRIECHQRKSHEYHRNPEGKKPPRLLKSLTPLCLKALKAEKSQLAFIQHHKKRRLNRLELRLKALCIKAEDNTVSICFGGGKRQKAVHHLKKNGYHSHTQWYRDYDFHRHNQSYWLGTHSEPGRNQNATLDPLKGTLRLRVPEALEGELGKYLDLEDVFFNTKAERRARANSNDLGPFQSPELLAAFFHGSNGKNTPFSYRIVEPIPGQMVVQVSFEPVPKAISSRRDLGAFGIDFNADHLAIAELDRFGNPINAKSYYFETKEKSGKQIAAIMGDLTAEITAAAKEAGKPIILEDLEFAKKKAALKEEGGKDYRKILSSLAYRKFREHLASRCRKQGVQLESVNPAFTSIIGYYKYRHSSSSTHECAAVAIARRGLRYSERPKVHGTRKGTASIPGEHEPQEFFKENPVRHVWSFYSRKASLVRHSIRSYNKELSAIHCHIPHHPSARQEALRILRESTDGKLIFADTG